MNKNIPIDFNSSIYIELNEDLKDLSDIEAKIHYENEGYKENRKYKYENIPSDFNSSIYIELNEDLKDLSDIKAKIHYENEGYKENRKYKYNDIDTNFNIYVYCCGKSGSSTLTHTMNKNGYKALHVHSALDYKNYCIEYKKNPNLFDIIEQSMINNRDVYIIDSYRTHIERKLSSFFQNYQEDIYSIDYITSIIDKQIYFIENYVAINEIFDYFNIPHFDSFNFVQKYNLLKYKNITFIKLRFEDIKEWDTILSSIFKKNIKIYNDNLSENKKYINEYNIIKTQYKIPNYMIEIIQNDNEFKIYNTLESQEKYINFWKQKTKSVKNIPHDFDAKIYIELNKDLKNLTELQSKIHYENDGYKENRKYKYENIPDNFDAKIYIELNEDLKNLTELEAKNHYENDGYKENRKYKYLNLPDNFDAKIYIELNEDLKNLTELQSKIHYEIYGYKENRNIKYK
jgi:hypothetical protein